MPAYEVSRTLVKSPPEVWSELERVERLAELLGDAAITITRRDPETTIEWQGAAANGTIEIGASGWGTKVRLTAQVTAASQSSPNVATAPKLIAEPELADTPNFSAEIMPEPDSECVASDPAAPVQEPCEDAGEAVAKTSLWRKFRDAFSSPKAAIAQKRDDADDASVDVESAGDATGDVKFEVVSKPEAVVELEATPESKADALPEAETEPEAQSQPEAEPVDFESVLTAVLDHLGSAHKRPFTAS